MNLVELEQRVTMLQTESQKAAGQVASFADNLEKAKINLHTINGHLNEANYQWEIAKQEAMKPKADEPCEPVE